MVQQLRRRYRGSGIRALAEALVIQKRDGSFSESTFKSIPHVGRRTFELFISDGLIELQSPQGTERRFVVTNKGKSIVQHLQGGGLSIPRRLSEWAGPKP